MQQCIVFCLKIVPVVLFMVSVCEKLTNPWSTVLAEKLTHSQLVKKFSTFYRHWKFTTAFTTTHHVSVSWVRSIQSKHPPSITFLKIQFNFSSHLCLGLPSGLFPSVSPPKPSMHISPAPKVLHAQPSHSS